ncbi:unnamed protein product [Cuscuta epithymum]|uniref:Uncharacterized protein n=1 Tax=Cuscuta epithymum TaxID=186058 RepID=A0AAV0C8Y1_9ASTE|nr:unnamed protein product [Cuscuta epithymum]
MDKVGHIWVVGRSVVLGEGGKGSSVAGEKRRLNILKLADCVGLENKGGELEFGSNKEDLAMFLVQGAAKSLEMVPDANQTGEPKKREVLNLHEQEGHEAGAMMIDGAKNMEIPGEQKRKRGWKEKLHEDTGGGGDKMTL